MSKSPAPVLWLENPPQRPMVVFDGNCGFCRAWVDRWRAAAGDKLDFEPSTAALLRYPEIAAADPDQAMLLIGKDGSVTRGAQAVLLARNIAGIGRWLAVAYHRNALVAKVSEVVYSAVAKNRPILSKATNLLWAGHTERPSFSTAAWLFLRAVGLIYAIAFLSFWTQASGLIGPDGILPARDFLNQVAEKNGIERFWFIPTLTWISAGGWMLHLICLAGLASGMLALLGRWQRTSFIVAWICYLSVVSAGQDFMSYQWDILLLEAGVVAMFLAGPSHRAGWNAPEPSRIGVFLGKWLLFRLMFQSGVVKLAFGDATWLKLDALKHHFETQPLPTWIGWSAHQLPGWVLVGACAIMFAIELLLPFLIWAPRRLRHFAFIGLASLQVVILLTGNYTFFNWLTIALCFLLVSDDAWPRWLRNRVRNVPAAPRVRNVWVRALAPVMAIVIVFCGAARMPLAFARGDLIPEPVAYVARTFAPFGIGADYGLFRVMTTARYEIVIQGSLNGRNWETYEFSWKPGDIKTRPKFVAPFQPRLDWQMWFAALGEPRNSPWLIDLMHQMLRGKKPVLGLFANEPFEGKTPRYVRAYIYEYKFSKPGELWSRHRWWNDGMPEPYLPQLSLEQFGGK